MREGQYGVVYKNTKGETLQSSYNVNGEAGFGWYWTTASPRSLDEALAWIKTKQHFVQVGYRYEVRRVA